MQICQAGAGENLQAEDFSSSFDLKPAAQSLNMRCGFLFVCFYSDVNVIFEVRDD